MKQFFAILFLLVIQGSIVLAQAPQSINYQGVARNSGGIPYAAQPISVKLSIHNGSASGSIVYSETRSLTTNQFGLFNVQIGSAGASNVQGSFNMINWSAGQKFLQTEISINGQPYIDLGTTQMMSVPYAINSLQTKQLVLPFDTAFGNSDYVLKVKNTSNTALAAVFGESTNGAGLSGRSSNDHGVVGSSSGTNSAGVSGYNNAQGGHGVDGFIVGTNTTGAGVHGVAEYGAGVMGETAYGKAVVGKVANGGTGSGVNGESNGPGNGVYGTSATGSGVFGVATSSSGIAGKFFHWNSAGKALDVTGNVKISGGNTNPGAGKVLTSDASGNATWQAPQGSTPVAFYAEDPAQGGLQNLPNAAWYKIHCANESYDPSNNYQLYTQSPSSTFIVPSQGLYHFKVSIFVETNSIWTDLDVCELRILRWRNGVTTVLASNYDDSVRPWAAITDETTEFLLPGDRIWAETFSETDDSSNPILTYCEFLGYLIK